MSGDRFRVLLVEENPHDARVLETVLAAEQTVTYQVEWVNRLSAACQRLAAGGLDIVLVDLSLPDSEGLDTFLRLRSGAPDVPIVVLARADTQDLALLAVQAGAQDFLVKQRDGDETMGRAIHCAIERVRTNRHVRQREEQLRLLAEQLPCLFWSTDLHLRFTSFAGRNLTELGIAAEEVTGRTVSEQFAAEQAGPGVIEAHRQAVTGRSTTLEVQWKRRIYHVHVAALRQQDGRPIGTIGLAVDITDQRLVNLELRHARRIHAGLLPSSAPQLDGFDIGGASSALAETGGDYFDYFAFGDGTTGVVVCDVAGHGLGPAMMMCHARAYVRALAWTHDDPGRILSLANRFLCSDIKEDRLITLFLAQLDPQRRALRYANAGHLGYLLRSNVAAQFLAPTGVPLNVLEESAIGTSEVFELAPGDLVVLCTDGIVDSLGPDGTPFGAERMCDVVRREQARPSDEIVDALFRTVRQFSPQGSLSDDMTAVVIKAR